MGSSFRGDPAVERALSSTEVRRRRPKRKRRMRPATRYAIGALVVFGLAIVIQSLVHMARTDPRDSRAIAERELQVNSIQPGERVHRQVSVFKRPAIDYFRATRDYLETHGKPVAFYSDKHGIFRVNNKDAIGGDGITQFGRVLSELNIDIICANSPQAKGRVERAFGTLQDRLVKELRLAGISTIAAANAWLPGFMTTHNARFGREPANAKDLHRPLSEADDLSEILAWREERTVTRNLTLHYDRMMLLLDPTPLARGLVRKKVEIVNYPDGRFAIQCNGVSLPYRVFDKIQTVQPGAIVENKRLGAALAMVKEQQAAYAPHKRRYDPARQRPPNNLEAPGLPSKGRPPRHVVAAPPG